jgi:hypothetical protein
MLFYFNVEIDMKHVVFLLMSYKVLFNDSRWVSDVNNPGISFPEEVIPEPKYLSSV